MLEHLTVIYAMHAGSGSSRLGQKFSFCFTLVWFWKLILLSFFISFNKIKKKNKSKEKIITNKTILPSKYGFFDWQFSATIHVHYLLFSKLT